MGCDKQDNGFKGVFHVGTYIPSDEQQVVQTFRLQFSQHPKYFVWLLGSVASIASLTFLTETISLQQTGS